MIFSASTGIISGQIRLLIAKLLADSLACDIYQKITWPTYLKRTVTTDLEALRQFSVRLAIGLFKVAHLSFI